MDSVRPSVENWIRFHFGDDWPGRQWLLESPESWMRSGDVMLTFFAEVFENAEQFLGDFAEDDLDEALWRLVWQGYEVRAMINLQAPWPMRERALSSIIPFFRDFLFDRCLPVLGHMSEKPNRPLNSICYMWWDIFPTWGQPEIPERAQTDQHILDILRELLYVPHDAIRESALHGLGHWQSSYPEVAKVIREWRREEQGLRPELLAYAAEAKRGDVP